ncbi:enoyl-CoA hydratase [Arthrobacter sp. PAMC 25486]|uniref:enoyl-CoA hydratase family protein n=1 Tax=Arthrobacter sp. PAMC 25486 TaxID=1494608 RepID=UPI000535AC30|nr:enoyl-CoA hydratase family protein [Arthrobacter sp. PAMC 25486]AIY01367.1 enoyl-CoA hydratase [Arthrobacter sp. PAMC 25486]
MAGSLEAAELVRYAVDAGIATLTLDSPGNRNALSRQLVGELVARLEHAAAATGGSVRGILLTHTGSVFCAGADLKEAGAHGVEAGARDLVQILRTILTVSVPVIARVDGMTRAGGLGILGACDIVVANSAATFAFSEVRIGLGPAIISLTTMPRMNSRAVSRYYLTGETFDAAEAQAAGLITVAADDVDAALEPILFGIRQGSPQGLAESKKLAAAPMLTALNTGAEDMAALSSRLFTTDEATEGMAAFLERRKPAWHLPAS